MGVNGCERVLGWLFNPHCISWAAPVGDGCDAKTGGLTSAGLEEAGQDDKKCGCLKQAEWCT